MKPAQKLVIWLVAYFFIILISVLLFLLVDLTPDVQILLAILMLTMTAFLSYYIRRTNRP